FEIGISGETRLLEHVAKALLPPTPARLRTGSQRVDQPDRLVTNLRLPDTNLLDHLAQACVMVDAFLFDLLQSLFITLEHGLDRLKQGLELLLVHLACLIEPGIGAFEEVLLRLAEQLAAYLAELRTERFASLEQLGETRLECPIPFLLGGGKA